MQASKDARRKCNGKRRLTYVGILLFGLLLWADINLKPVVLSMAEAQARVMAVEAVNHAVHDIIRDDVTYGDLMSVLMDDNGRVAMLQANTVRMNELGTRTALAAQRNLKEMAATGISIPWGAALGSRLFAGSGPAILVKIVPMGAVSTEFVSEFNAAGINQTRHKIYLKINTMVRMVIPTGAGTATVISQVPVAESIIVGQVPQSFVDVANQQDMLNLIPGVP
ncbi:MAG: sporulation protein YunB [Clostridia bacterium]